MVSSPVASSMLESFSMRWTIAPGILTISSSDDWVFRLETASSSGKRFSARSFMSAEGYRDVEEEGEMGFEADMVLDWLVSEFCQCLVWAKTQREILGVLLGLD